MSKVESGRYVELSEKRLVFVGTFFEEPDAIAIAFKNGAGEVTRLKLSTEAAEALKGLLTKQIEGILWDGDSSLLAERMVFQWTAVMKTDGTVRVEL